MNHPSAKHMDRPGGLVGLSLLGAVSPAAVAMMLAFVATESLPFLACCSLDALGARWDSTQGLYGMLSLVGATVLIGFLTGALSVLVGTPAALRLAYFAQPAEARLCESLLALMAGLPSIVVGIAGLKWVTPVAGFSVLSGVATVLAMSLPAYILLVTASLRIEGDRCLATCRALGMTDRQFAYSVALRSVRPACINAAALAVGKSLGEATALSLVIGNVTRHPWPGLFEPAHTLTTAILKDHTGASGMHHSALFAAAIVLAMLILGVQAAGIAMARRTARHH